MFTTTLKTRSALFLQAAIVVIGAGALGFLLWEPHIEGRNVHATVFEIYFEDPFLAYVYAGSIPFFIALVQAFRMFGHVRATGSISQSSVNALRIIKRCAIVMIGFVAGGVVFIILFGDRDDRPAGVFMSFLVTCIAVAIAVAAATFERNLRDALRQSVDNRT
jgi:hypothetical protein